MQGLVIRIKGKVQGVGFRPFVWQLAHQLSLNGEVLNDGEGVLIRLAGISADSEPFRQLQVKLHQQLPPLASIDALTVTDTQWVKAPHGFTIAPSAATSVDTQVVPDAATCPACLQELYQPDNRRYQYPFINCTHCGPRFTIIRALPYDRPDTVMHAFPLCPECKAEYQNPADRRYHAQPVACSACGPEVWFVGRHGTICSSDWLEQASAALDRGEIIAIKSLGGFHLACNASDPAAVLTLRNRKHRWQKPFAVMVRDIAAVKELAHCPPAGQEMLTSRIAPIVLLRKQPSALLADNIAPGLTEIGVMLPSNPLQHLLLSTCRYPLVMTSANVSGLPPATDNDTAVLTLSNLVDGFIMHNRQIVQRCDDSLVRIDNKARTEVLRRSRGLVPDALELPDDFPDVDGFLAYGGDLKNAFAVGKGQRIIVSQYLGDLANTGIQQQYIQAMQHYLSLYHIHADHHVTDLHPGYFSYQLANKACDQSSGDRLTRVQHHHAHVAACLIENGWTVSRGNVLALALDGLGLGNDNTFWGGELLIADYQTCRQIGGIPAVSMLGGDKAATEPWRSFYAHLTTFAPDISETELAALLPGKPIHQLNNALKKRVNCHTIRSAGRLFDAVAFSLGIVSSETPLDYEGQAACQLEALALQCPSNPEPPFLIPGHGLTLDLQTFWQRWLKHCATGSNLAEKAYQFHAILAQSLANLVSRANAHYSLDHLVLTGGVFHNALLRALVKQALPPHIRVLEHHLYSCGDGGLALGQLAVAACQADRY